MDEHDEIPEDVAYLEATFNGVVHRVPVTPEQAPRWIEREEAIGYAIGEPAVDEDGWLVEEHRNVMSEADVEDPYDDEPYGAYSGMPG